MAVLSFKLRLFKPEVVTCRFPSLFSTQLLRNVGRETGELDIDVAVLCFFGEKRFCRVNF